MMMAVRLKHTRILMTVMCLLETKKLALILSLFKSFLQTNYHLSLLCSYINQQSLLLLILSEYITLSAVMLYTNHNLIKLSLRVLSLYIET